MLTEYLEPISRFHQSHESTYCRPLLLTWQRYSHQSEDLIALPLNRGSPERGYDEDVKEDVEDEMGVEKLEKRREGGRE